MNQASAPELAAGGPPPAEGSGGALGADVFFDAPAPLVVTDAEGHLVVANAAARELLGAAAPGLGLLVDAAPAEDRARLARERRRIALEGGRAEQVWTFAGDDGHPVTMRETMAGTKLAGDRRACVSFLEIAPNGAGATAASRPVERERCVDAALAEAPVGLFAVDTTGTLVLWAGSACRFLVPGFSGGEGTSVLEAWKESDLLAHVLRALGGERYAETYLADADHAFEGWFTPVYDADDTILSMVGLVVDATHQRRIVADLQAKMGALAKERAVAELVGRVLDQAPLVLTSTDASGIVRMSRGHGLEALGRAAGELVGQPLRTAVGDAAAAERFLGALEGLELTVLSRPAPDVAFENWCLPMRDPGSGEVCGVNVLSLDISARVNAEAELREKLELIERQTVTIRALATPIMKVWKGVLCLPIIGTVDSQRAADMMQALLEACVREAARVAIVDLTGVEIVDTATADHILQIFRAAKVLGVDGILSGIRPAVAQTIVSLGVDLQEVRTERTLEAALRLTLQRKA